MDVEYIGNPHLAYEKCEVIARSISDPVLKKVAVQVLEENMTKLLKVKGSDWEHHNYTGGLIVHTCSVTQNAIKIAEFYGDKVDISLVKFCALMHDIGKVFDYSVSSSSSQENEFPNSNDISMNQSLLGHSFEGATYIVNKLQQAYISDETIMVSAGYMNKVITQVAHCIGAHMNGFGACAKQQMIEAIIIGCTDKIDAYIEQTILEDKEDRYKIGTGEVIYKSALEDSMVKKCHKGDNHENY